MFDKLVARLVLGGSYHRHADDRVSATTLLRARRDGPEPLRAAVARLEGLATRRVQDLLRPRHPLLHLATRGFGVRLV